MLPVLPTRGKSVRIYDIIFTLTNSWHTMPHYLKEYGITASSRIAGGAHEKFSREGQKIKKNVCGLKNVSYICSPNQRGSGEMVDTLL